MRICLLSLIYPPADSTGIARQRQALAIELARRSHDVHVVTCGASSSTRIEQGVQIHEVLVSDINLYSHQYPALNIPLTQSQALYEGLAHLSVIRPFDIVDIPLWSAQGFVTFQRYQRTTILWLQTSKAQLLHINGSRPSLEEKAQVALEQICLERASGWLAGSQGALESITHAYAMHPPPLNGVAHLGLPPLPTTGVRTEPNSGVEALVVGRLEQRKGTPRLFEVIPGLLNQFPQLRIRFVGSDNSADDNWYKQHRMTYSEYFRDQHPDLSQRVIFEGYVDENRLAECYRKASFQIVPSIYESFGLVYLEAMRSALPVVTFAIDAALEIFPNGESDGAILVPPTNKELFAAAIGRIMSQPGLRQSLGQRGLARYRAAFTSEAMTDATLAFYERAIDQHSVIQVNTRPRTVYQVMEALDIGDAVSNITRRNAALLADLGQPAPILARHTHPDVKGETRPIQHALSIPDCGLIFHYWNYNTSTWILSAVKGPKAIHYHNITPAHYFPPDSQGFRDTSHGYAQLPKIADLFDLIIGDSRYNIVEFTHYLSRPKPTLVLYPVIEVNELLAAPYDVQLLGQLRKPRQINIVFVGRIARNKRQEQLMLLFDQYYRDINRHAHLWLVGNDQSDVAYRTELERLRESLTSKEVITFTGKVSDPEVNAYYRAADVFVSASEHEGFCMPIAQAMALNVPVLAYATTAVPETMGNAGILIHDWDTHRLAELMHLTLFDQDLRHRLVTEQQINLERFSKAEARKRLAAAISYLQSGQINSLFEFTNHFELMRNYETTIRS